MKKSILKCFAVDDAVQDGINEFGRLSGYGIHPNRPQKINGKKQPLVKNGLLMTAAILLLKGFK